MGTNSPRLRKRFPLELLILTGVPILAIAFLLMAALSFDIIPLDSAGDPTMFGKILGFVAGCSLLSIPICFIVEAIGAVFSQTVRERIRAHKWLYALWGVASLLIFFSLFATGHMSPNSRVMRTVKTKMELNQIYAGVLAYETEYGTQPDSSNNREVVAILSGKNPRKLEIITFSHWELDSKGTAIDAWGTPLRILLSDPKNPRVQSAGADQVWGTPDDLSGENYP